MAARPPTTGYLARWIAPALVVGGVVIAGALGWTQPARAQQPPPDLVTRGRAVYQEACESCHQADGAGQPAQGIPTLRGVGAASVDFFVSTGRMPEANLAGQAPRKPATISADDRAALVAYVSTTWRGGPDIPTLASGIDLTDGGDLFRSNCSACHSAAGAGAALAYGAYAPSLAQATPVQVAEAARIGPGNMPVFQQTTINAQQLSNIAAYVQYLRHPRDRGGASLGHTGPIAEGFVGLLVGVGAAVGITAFVGDRSDADPVERTHE